MQTPAAFEYERATSVEGAIASLERLGPEARIIAGGHSLLPMMKLRLANPEHLIDINDLAELVVHPRGGRRDQDRRAHPARRPAQVGPAGPASSRSSATPRTVIADPVVRNRGTIGGSLCQADAAEDLSAVCTALKADAVIRGTGGERVVGMDEFHVGPYMTAVGAGRDADRGAPQASGRAAGSAHEKVERRAGDWAIAAASAAVCLVGGRSHDVGHRAQRGRADDHPPHPRRGSAARPGAVGGAVRAGRRDRGRRLLARCRRPRAGRLQAPSRRRAHPSCTAPGDGARPAAGGLTINVSITLNGEQVTHDVEPRSCSCTSSARRRPDGHPLGLRHLQLRRLRGADGRRSRSSRAPSSPRCATGTRSAPSSRSRSTAGWIRSSRASTSCTPCSAASARRAC